MEIVAILDRLKNKVTFELECIYINYDPVNGYKPFRIEPTLYINQSRIRNLITNRDLEIWSGDGQNQIEVIKKDLDVSNNPPSIEVVFSYDGKRWINKSNEEKRIDEVAKAIASYLAYDTPIN